MPASLRWCRRLARVLSLLLVSSLATVVLMRAAPGYFDDERELSAEHADTVRAQLQAERQRSALGTWVLLVRGTVHGDCGTSRQYGTPVWPLLWPRLRTTAGLIVPAVALGSLAALVCAVLCNVGRARLPRHGVGGVATAVCAVPVSVLALCCMLSNRGGPATVLFVLVAARDVRFFTRLLRRHAAAPHLLFARANGIATVRLWCRHLLWPMRQELAALVLTSFLIALNAALPVEVIFGVPGAGQLAWNAAMNRDLPVLLAVTLVLSLCIGTVGLLQPGREGAAA